MALKRNYYLNDVLVEPPVNAPETAIKFNFEKDSFDTTGNPKLALSITDFEWARENNDTIQKHFNDGKIFQGLPIRYELDRNGVIQKIFDGYIDLSDNARFGRNTSIATSKQKKNIDWLNDTADSVSFEYLFNIGVIKNADFKFMPYVLNKVPDYQEAAIAILSAAYLTDRIIDQLREIAKMATDAANPLTTANAILKFIFYVVYLLALIAAAILLLLKIINYIIQPVKYHACMNVKTILERGASHFGFTFKSEIFDTEPFKRLTYMPIKRYNPLDTSKNSFGIEQNILGYTTPNKILQRGYPDGTFGDFLREIKKVFRSKIVINNSELTLVPEYFNTGSAQYILPDLYQPEFTTNAHELSANYVLSFATDLEDKNTIQEYKGTSLQVITKQTTSVPVELNLLKKIEDVQLSFALAKTKKELTVPEKILDVFFGAVGGILNGLINGVNAVINTVNEVGRKIQKIINILKKIKINIPFDFKEIPKLPESPIANLIENRIGMMKIETDLFMVHKLFLMTEGVTVSDLEINKYKNNKLSSDNDTVLSAKYLYDNFHKKSVSFLPSAGRPNGNQYIIKQFDDVPFKFTDMQKVISNNNIQTADGKAAVIDDGEWNDWNEKAKLKVRISQLYATDLQEVYIEPDGR